MIPASKQVKVLGVGKIHFSNDSPELMLKYEVVRQFSGRAHVYRRQVSLWKYSLRT
jgi:hypothetical protein